MAGIDVEKLIQRCKEIKEAIDPTPKPNTLEWFLRNEPQMFKRDKHRDKEYSKIWRWKDHC